MNRSGFCSIEELVMCSLCSRYKSLSTLGALDQAKCWQQQELAQGKHENAVMKAQLNHYVAVVKAVEGERDDMQDTVLNLIEKGELIPLVKTCS